MITLFGCAVQVMSLGIYISIPFCKTKCSYCNFASGVFSAAMMTAYVDRLCADIMRSAEVAGEMGAQFEAQVDTVFWGGGTPNLLPPHEIERIMQSARNRFTVAAGAEVTVECAPSLISDELLQTFAACGINRVSLGVQSFIDDEARAVGRVHGRSAVHDDIRRLRASGISNINVDLITGLPHQNLASWKESVEEAIQTGVPHLSLYMLEVDDESRLGAELLAGGARYHAHHVPDDDLIADCYLWAVERLQAAGLQQYEISNFARPGLVSKHNLKYWKRLPYMGFGVDAHSMLRARFGGPEPAVVDVRFAVTDSLTEYLAGRDLVRTGVTPLMAFEEEMFLGLRMNEGVDLAKLSDLQAVVKPDYRQRLAELESKGLIERQGANMLRLTNAGRLLSNEVFQSFLT